MPVGPLCSYIHLEAEENQPSAMPHPHVRDFDDVQVFPDQAWWIIERAGSTSKPVDWNNSFQRVNLARGFGAEPGQGCRVDFDHVPKSPCDDR